MAVYFCKCGRQVNKSTSADNTGNRDTADCIGCPYLLPWGPDKYIEGQGFRKEVQGYECRMSPTISYTTSYRGQANDKCTLHILSLDLDFLDTVQAWIYDHAADTLTAGFSRGSMRGTDFSDKGRYSLSISCAQNKKGMATKAALIEQFFTGGRVRKDMTLAQEKAHILAAIKRGKENASKMKYTISEHQNGLMYAYYKGQFWFWHKDQNKWVPSAFATQQYDKAKAKDSDITPEMLLDNGSFNVLEEYQVPLQRRTALEALTPADSQAPAPDDREITKAPPAAAPASGEAPEIVDECSESDEECPYLQPLENSKKYSCQCSLCGDKFVNREICNKSFRGCGWYQDQQEKDARQDDEEEIPATDSCQCRTCEHESCFAHGCTKECPANAEESCLTTSCPEYREKPQVTANPTHAARNAQPCVPGASGVQTSPSQSADAGAQTDGSDDKDVCSCAVCYREDCTCAGGLDAASRNDCAGEQNCQQSGCTYAAKHRAPLTDEASFPADAGAAEQSLPAAGPASLAAKDTNVPTFDYSGLDGVTVDTLHLAENIIRSARQKYIIDLAGAVDMAHEELVRNSDGHNQHTEETFVAWCRSVGISKTTAYQLLQVQALLSGSTPEEQATLEAASPSLLYAAAKPSAPAELVQAVKDGDITSHKQYQDLLSKLKAEQAAREKAETDAAYYRTDSESARAAADDYHRKYEDANTRCNALLDQQTGYITAKQDAESRARAAENRAAGAQKLAEQRGTENTELKAKIRELEDQPRDVAVVQPGEEQIEVWRREGADRMAATMQETVRKANDERLKAQNRVTYLQEQLATARPDADACQRTADTLYETAENLRILLRTQLKQAQLSPTAYGKVVAHVLQVARTLLDTVRVCAPDGYDMDSEEDDDFE